MCQQTCQNHSRRCHARRGKTVGPSALRRWLLAPSRKGVGSNPTASSVCVVVGVEREISIGNVITRQLPTVSVSMKLPTCATTGVSRAGARTRLQLTVHGDMQGFDSSFPAVVSPVCTTFSRRLKDQSSAHGAEHDIFVETNPAKPQACKSWTSSPSVMTA